MSKVVALHDKVVLKKIEETTKMVGGIIVPDTGKEKSNYFEVVSVGKGMWSPENNSYYPMNVEVGQTVIVPKAVVVQVVVDDEEYFVCREVEILSVIQED